MKFRILYFPEPVDCTSDPHYVHYTSEKEMMNDAIKVCESHLVKAICSVRCYDEDNLLLESDVFMPNKLASVSFRNADQVRESELAGGRLMTGPYAKKHKIEGLYFYADAETKPSLPPGLTGVKYVAQHLEELLEKGMKELIIGVVWTYFDDHNCSDYIAANFNGLYVDYCNQDWYRSDEANYRKHILELAALLGVHPNELENELP